MLGEHTLYVQRCYSISCKKEVNETRNYGILAERVKSAIRDKNWTNASAEAHLTDRRKAQYRKFKGDLTPKVVYDGKTLKKIVPHEPALEDFGGDESWARRAKPESTWVNGWHWSGRDPKERSLYGIPKRNTSKRTAENYRNEYNKRFRELHDSDEEGAFRKRRDLERMNLFYQTTIPDEN